jgi:hypothetical protein
LIDVEVVKMKKLIRMCLAVLLMTANISWAQALEKTIESANFEVVFVDGNERGRLIVRAPDCLSDCQPTIFVVERGLPVYLNTGKRIALEEFIKMKRGVADVQYKIATDELVKIRLQ